MALQPIGVQATVQDADTFFSTTAKMNKAVADFVAPAIAAAKAVDSFAVAAAKAAQTQKLTDRLSEQQTALKILEQELAKVTAKYGEGSIEAQKKQAAIDKLTNSINRTETALKNEQTALVDEGKAAEQTTPEVKALGNATEKAGKDAEQGGKGFDAFGQIVIGALREAGAMAMRFAADAGRALAGFLKDSIGVAGDFEQGMNKFAVVAGKGVDTKGLQQFRDLFIQLGRELPVSTSEVEDAATEMISGGIDPAIVAAGGLRQTLNFAAAAGLSLADAAQTSAKFLAGWTSSSTSAADQVAFLTLSTDTLTKAAAASSTTAAELRLGLFNVQGAAQELHVTFQDTTATLALLAPAFQSSAQAGTALSVFMTRLVPATKPAISAMEDLGLITKSGQNIFFDAKGNFLGMANAAEVLKTKLGGLTDAQKIATLHTLFGDDAQKVANLLMQDGAAGLDGMIAKMNAASGVSEAAATMQQGYNVALENAKGSVEALQITVGSYLLPVLTDLMNNVIAPAINTLSTFASAVFGNDDAMASLSAPLQSAAGYVRDVAMAFTGWYDGTLSLKTALDVLSPGIGQLVAPIQAVVAEFTRLSSAFDTGGISSLIDTIVADITSALPAIETALLGWGQALIDWVEPYIPPMLAALNNAIAQAWNWVQAQAPGWLTQLEAWGQQLVAWVAPMIPPALAELGKLGTELIAWIGEQSAPLLAKLETWGQSFIAWIPGATVTFLAEWPKMFDAFLTWIGNEAGPLLAKLGTWAVSFVQWIAPMIPGFVVALGGIALAIGTFILETAAVLEKKMVQWGISMTSWVGTEVLPKLPGVLNSILVAANNWITDAEKALGAEMVKVGSALIEGMKQGISNSWSGMKSYVNNLAGQLPEWFKAYYHIQSPSQLMADIVGAPIGMGIVQGIESTLPDMQGTVTSVATVLGGIGKAASAALANVGKGIAGAGTQAVSGARSLATTLTNFMSANPLSDQSEGWGKGLVDGLVQGINGAAKSANKAAAKLMDGVAASGKDAGKIASPSQVTDAMGQDWVMGLIQGMGKMAPALNNLVTTVFNTLQANAGSKFTAMRDDIQKQVDDFTKQVTDIQAAIGSFAVTGLTSDASIDRQKAANIAAMDDLSAHAKTIVQQQLADAEKVAAAINDPKQQAAYFAARSKAILEMAKLQTTLDNQISDQERENLTATVTALQNAIATTTNDVEKQSDQILLDKLQTRLNTPQLMPSQEAALTQQIALISAAQQNEAQALLAQQAQGSDTSDLVKQVQDFLTAVQNVKNGPTVTDPAIQAFMNTIDQLRQMPATPAQLAAGSSSTSTAYNNTNINMPVYTNQSPAVMQQSMAIIGASLG